MELTNFEVRVMFRNMIRKWFGSVRADYNDFIKALLLNDLKAMNNYMNRVTVEMFSYFDAGRNPSGAEPERFYHGFVLGLMVELTDRYSITSNRESGFGRYDIILEPRRMREQGDGSAAGGSIINDAVIIEFKVQDTEEKELSDTVQETLHQIREKNYQADLMLIAEAPGEQENRQGIPFVGRSGEILDSLLQDCGLKREEIYITNIF